MTKPCERTRRLLIQQYQQYPELQIRDVLKFLHQSAFGCEHLVTDAASAVAYIRAEHAENDCGAPTEIEFLDGAYARVPLSYLNKGLDAQTFGGLFAASAKQEVDGAARLEDKLCVAAELVKEGALPFSTSAFETAVQEWRQSGFAAVRHSEEFRRAYRPAYRVISRDYLPFLPLLAELDTRLKEQPVVLAVEGGSASGKTTLSKLLETLYDCTVFHMDDFFLRPEQRTPERYREIGGNVDRERFLDEVLVPLSKKEPILYRRFDCSTLTVCPPITVEPKRLTVIEGAYSMHPELAGYYDLSVFLDVAPAFQKARIEKRNTPPMAKRFFEEWIPLERVYFNEMQVKERCDLSITIDE